MAPRPGSLEERRKLMHDRTIAAVGDTPPDLDEYEQAIPMSDHHNNIAIVVQQKEATLLGPLVLLFFGGGFCSGEPKQMVPYGRGLARLYNAVVVCCDYRLAPEFRFPQAPRDAYDALEWCAHNAFQLKADPAKGFIVGGVSAGGNLSGVITALSVERRLSPKLTGQWLSVPCFWDEETVPEEYKEVFISRDMNATVPGMGKAAMKAMLDTYSPDTATSYYNPMFSKAEVKDLPPALVQVDGMDPLLSDGLIYPDIVEKSGVSVQSHIYPGQVGPLSRVVLTSSDIN
jgi:acetyl esterase/lipase